MTAHLYRASAGRDFMWWVVSSGGNGKLPVVHTSRTSEVLGLYRKIMRAALIWREPELDFYLHGGTKDAFYARSITENQDNPDYEMQKIFTEREYIRTEARRWFKLHRHIIDPVRIQAKLDEAEARYQLAMHYRIPDPRKQNLFVDPVSKQQITVVDVQAHSYDEWLEGRFQGSKETLLDTPVQLTWASNAGAQEPKPQTI
eukprot:TRINITY_DN19276_c0_g1_i1.p1 TRINITY_DN19276_c0_g1~~TRINITY_DN19276_c0_g1_i1.p1  ORF type:complete len:201 (-),score=0.89 TRINITY_DN19276_c0_g1_i1:87-689(-)